MSVVIIVGPAGCGKTRNAEALARHYHCQHVREAGEPHVSIPTTGRTLLLTNSLAVAERYPYAPVILFQDAVKHLTAV